jgi:hypothetical protein
MQRPTNSTYNHITGDVPIVSKSVIEINGSEVIPDEEYYAVAICPMLTLSSPMGILKHVPSTTHPINCFPEGANAQQGVYDCKECCTGSYVWLTTTDGDIASICIGDDCTNHNEDGFQDVYP